MNGSHSSRRSFLKSSTLAVVGCASDSAVRAEDLPGAVEDLKVISQLPERYHGWPTVARRASGELMLVCSGGRESHVCPFGRVEWMRSRDGGETWTFPRVIHDGPIDDRDAGVLETAAGTILVTTFSSLAYEPSLTKKAGETGRRWQAVHQRLNEEARQEALGTWMLRSTDAGATFSRAYRVPVNSPHGPIQLSDGRLLYPGKMLWSEEKKVGVCVSSDDGETWQWLAEIPTRKGDRYADYHELHGVETADGRVIVHIRNHNKTNAGETLQCESSDGGKTWSEPHAIGVWGLPSHLLRLGDGRLVMSYGYRRPPYGNQARVSDDGGMHWGPAITLSADGVSGDLGYPSTVDLGGGRLLTVWYEQRAESPRAVLRQARWALTS